MYVLIIFIRRVLGRYFHYISRRSENVCSSQPESKMIILALASVKYQKRQWPLCLATPQLRHRQSRTYVQCVEFPFNFSTLILVDISLFSARAYKLHVLRGVKDQHPSGDDRCIVRRSLCDLGRLRTLRARRTKINFRPLKISVRGKSA